MDLVVNVPLSTILADVDESIRDLLKFELKRHGFDEVEVAFDAPSSDWSGQLSQPTVNLFLYDLREALEKRRMQWDEQKIGGRVVESRPPMLLECSYAVTAWTKAVQDEHRLLSQVLAILHAYPYLPTDMVPKLPNGSSFPLEGTVGLPKGGDKSDFWSAVKGQYKVSLDYVIVISLDTATMMERGPEVLTHTLRSRAIDAPKATITEQHGVGGMVFNANNEALANAWVVLPELGLWTATDQNGYYVFTTVPAGTHKYGVRAPDGTSTQGEITVPSKDTDVIIGKKVEVSRKRST